ncbi:hypothetical protein Hanom_Chr05g00441101 [Helianthus anomalus]
MYSLNYCFTLQNISYFMNTIIPGVTSGTSAISDSTTTASVVVPWETEPSERRRGICFKRSVLNTCLHQNRQQFCLSCSGVSGGPINFFHWVRKFIGF